jgi:hypothetical protein
MECSKPCAQRAADRLLADRSEFRGARFKEDKTDQQVLRATDRKLACDGYRRSADLAERGFTLLCSAITIAYDENGWINVTPAAILVTLNLLFLAKLRTR